jgi:hypothetical protein
LQEFSQNHLSLLHPRHKVSHIAITPPSRPTNVHHRRRHRHQSSYYVLPTHKHHALKDNGSSIGLHEYTGQKRFSTKGSEPKPTPHLAPLPALSCCAHNQHPPLSIKNCIITPPHLFFTRRFGLLGSLSAFPLAFLIYLMHTDCPVMYDFPHPGRSFTEDCSWV